MRAKGAEFTPEMRKTHTIYLPNMLPYHGSMLCAAFRSAGFRLAIVPDALEYPPETFTTVSQDYCSPGIHIIGNILALVRSPETDPDRIAFLEPQSGGICKAGNLYHAIINSLRRSGYPQIPVISLNPHSLERHSGFRLTLPLLRSAVSAVVFSDLLMLLTLQTRPYETVPGSTDRLHRQWERRLCHELERGRLVPPPVSLVRRILRSYRALPARRSGPPKRRVTITGEIYSKFAPSGNQGLESFLREQKVEYRFGSFLNYLIYCVYTDRKVREIGLAPSRSRGMIRAARTSRAAGVPLAAGVLSTAKAFRAACAFRLRQHAWRFTEQYLCRLQRRISGEVTAAGFVCDALFPELEQYARGIISPDYNIGDGWLVAAEAADGIRKGYDRVLMCHPFTCLVSHVGSRGVIRKLKTVYPQARITSIEYDYYGSKAMRDSRILMGIS